jgi:lysophospholipase L1-like esterase
MSVDNRAGLPRNWETLWTGKGKITAAIDRDVFKSQPASLRIATEGDEPAQGQVSQIIDAGPGTKVTISGVVKSAGEAKVNVFIQPSNAKWTPINFTQAAFVSGNNDWQAFEKTVELPEGTARFGVGMLIEGKGKAWLDDVKLKINGEEANAPADKPDEIYQPAKVNSPTVPSAAIFPQYPKAWTNFHNGYCAQAAKGKADLIFFGDSITQGWHKKYWEGEIQKLGKAFNFGIGGDGIQNVLWRIQNGELEGQSPKVVVVAIGVNNFWGKGGSDEGMAKGVGMIVDEIRQRCPSSKVLIVGIFPTQREKTNPLRQRVKNVNALNAKLADDKQVFFIDFGGKLLTEDGAFTADVSPDAVHLNEKGYGIYAENLLPKLKQLLSDTNAAPTGK